MDSGVVFSNLGEALERLEVRKNAEGGTPLIATEVLDAPADAASLEIERGLSCSPTSVFSRGSSRTLTSSMQPASDLAASA